MYIYRHYIVYTCIYVWFEYVSNDHLPISWIQGGDLAKAGAITGADPWNRAAGARAKAGQVTWRFTPVGFNRSYTRPGKLTVCELENGPVEIVEVPIKKGDFP